jgi:chemotaxis protein MotB
MAQDSDQDQQQGGAPAWMLTYGDSVTLLVTFFVMLLTFSTPDEEGYQQLALGLMQGARNFGVFKGEQGEDSLGPDERRLMEARLDTEGAEKRPEYGQRQLEELKRYYKEVDLAQLDELKGAVTVRVPLTELFGTGTELTPKGQAILDHLVRMTRAKPYSVVVRARAVRDLPPEERRSRALLLAARVVTYLREGAGEACRDIGLSDNAQLARPPLPEDHCEITMLEV